MCFCSHLATFTFHVVHSSEHRLQNATRLRGIGVSEEKNELAREISSPYQVTRQMTRKVVARSVLLEKMDVADVKLHVHILTVCSLKLSEKNFKSVFKIL